MTAKCGERRMRPPRALEHGIEQCNVEPLIGSGQPRGGFGVVHGDDFGEVRIPIQREFTGGQSFVGERGQYRARLQTGNRAGRAAQSVWSSWCVRTNVRQEGTCQSRAADQRCDGELRSQHAREDHHGVM